MPTETEKEMRKERIERLLNELSYEITRGVMQREIEPDLRYSQLMPYKDKTAGLEVYLHVTDYVPNVRSRLRLVK